MREICVWRIKMGKVTMIPPLIGLLLCFICWLAKAQVDYAKYKYQKQPINVRTKDLMDQMNLEEKIRQMVQIDRVVATIDIMKIFSIGSLLSSGGSTPLPNARDGGISRQFRNDQVLPH